MGLAQPEPPVDPRHPAVRVEELAVGHDRADVRLRVKIVAGAPDDEVRRLAEAVIACVVELAGRRVVRDEHPERRVAGLAGQLGADLRVDDGLGVDQIRAARRAEDLLPFEKERPQLGEEQRVPLVRLDLRAVRLDLREVGIEREVGGEVRRDAVLHVEPEVGLGVVLYVAGVGQAAELNGGRGRENLQVPAHRQAAQAAQRAHLREDARDGPCHRRPDQGLVLGLQRAGDLEAPAVLAGAAGRIAQALEGDRHLGRPPVVDDGAAGLEQRVPGRIAAAPRRPAQAPAAPEDGVPLDPVGVDREAVRALLVEKRIEHHRDPVVAPELVPVGTVRPYLGRVGVVCVESEVEVVGVVGDPHLGLLGRRRALDRVGLGEVGDEHRVAPGCVVQPAVDDGRLGGPLRLHAAPAAANREAGCRSGLRRRSRRPRRSGPSGGRGAEQQLTAGGAAAVRRDEFPREDPRAG